jgi:hypothetical protein
MKKARSGSLTVIFFLALIICLLVGAFVLFEKIQESRIDQSETTITESVVKENTNPDLKINNDTFHDLLPVLIATQLAIFTIILTLTFVAVQFNSEFQTLSETATIFEDRKGKMLKLIIIFVVIFELFLFLFSNIIHSPEIKTVLTFFLILIPFFAFILYLDFLMKRLIVKENLKFYIKKIIENNELAYYDFEIQPILDISNKLMKNKESLTLEESLKEIRIGIINECEKTYKKPFEVKIGDKDFIQYLKISIKITANVVKEKIFGFISRDNTKKYSGEFIAHVEGLSIKEKFFNDKSNSDKGKNKFLPIIQQKKILFSFKNGSNHNDSLTYDKMRFHDTIDLFFRIHMEFLSQAIESKFEKGIIIIIENIEIFLEELILLKERLKSENLDKDIYKEFIVEYKKSLVEYSEILHYTEREVNKLDSKTNAIIAIAWGKGKLWELQIKDSELASLKEIKGGICKCIACSKKYYSEALYDVANGILNATAYYGLIIMGAINESEKGVFYSDLEEKIRKNLEKPDDNNRDFWETYKRTSVSLLKILSLNNQSRKHEKSSHGTYKIIIATIQEHINSMQNSIGSSYLPYIKLTRIQSDYYYVVSDYDASIQRLIHAKNIVSHKYGSDHLQLAMILNHLSRVFLDKGEIGLSSNLCDQASRIRLNQGCPYKSSELAASLINYSLIYRLKGEKQKAIQFVDAVKMIRLENEDKYGIIAADIFQATIEMDYDLKNAQGLISKTINEIKKESGPNYFNNALFVGALHQEAIIYCEMALNERILPIKEPNNTIINNASDYFEKAKEKIECARESGKHIFGEQSPDYISLEVTRLHILCESNVIKNKNKILSEITRLDKLSKQIFDKRNQFKLNTIRAKCELYTGNFSESFEILLKNHRELCEIYPENSPYLLASRLNIANTLFCCISVLKYHAADYDILNRYTLNLYQYVLENSKEFNSINLGSSKNIEKLRKIISNPKKYREYEMEKNVPEILRSHQITKNVDEIQFRNNDLYQYKFKLELLPITHKFSDHIFLYQMTYF